MNPVYRTRLVAPALTISTLLATTACDSTDESANRPSTIEVGSQSVRLADVLSAAAIEGPLTEITAAVDLRAIGDSPRRAVFSEDFENFDLRRTGWRPNPAVTAQETDGGVALRLRGRLPRSIYGWRFPVEPNAFYVFKRRVRTAVPLDFDFALVEQDRTTDLVREGIAGWGAALQVHWPESPAADGAWHSGEVVIHTTPATRSAILYLRSALGQLDATRSRHDLWFDDLELEQVELDPRQRMALVKGRDSAPGADPTVGIAKRGQFPPHGSAKGRHRPEDNNFSHRFALYTPPPTDLTFRLQLKADTVLRFAVSLSRETPPNDAAQFEVLVREADGEQSLWSRSVTAVPGDWVWHDERVDLAGFTGRTVDLVLRTRTENGQPHPVWGNPVVDVPPQGNGPRNVILIAVDTLRADHLSCYGYGRPTTPHLDELAADGVRFDQVVANANWTCPSFASIFSGAGAAPPRGAVLVGLDHASAGAAGDTRRALSRKHGWATHAIVVQGATVRRQLRAGLRRRFQRPDRASVRSPTTTSPARSWSGSRGTPTGAPSCSCTSMIPTMPFTQPAPVRPQAFGADPTEKHDIELPFT